MVAFDRGHTLAARFRVHAGEQTHLYGYLLRALADDLDAGGPTLTVVRGYEDAPTGAVIQLRLLAGIFRLVLTGRAPTLVPFYPSLGGTADPAGVWPVLRPVIAEHAAELHDALAIAPQTNEVGRSVALLVGLFDLAAASGRHRIRLLEVGASAGLNQLVAHFRITGDDTTGQDWAWGPVDSPVQLLDAVQGPVTPVEVSIVSARGCDLDPVDPTSEEGQLRLTSFVWPFDLHRHQRLAGALELSAAQPPIVDRASAADWLRSRLGATDADEAEADAGAEADTGAEALPVVWHSITQLYWPDAEIEAVQAALSAYGSDHPLGEVGLEYDPAGQTGDWPEVRTRFWAGDGTPARERLLGTAHDHGIPVRVSGG